MELITSKTNRWVKLAEQLKHRKFRDKFSKFIMEGVRSADDARNQGIRDVVCFVTEKAYEEPRTKSIVQEAQDELHWLVLCVPEPIMKLISGTETSQGIVLIVDKPKHSQEELDHVKGHYVLLEKVQDPGNLGTIIRTAAAAGCRGILLTEGSTDAYSEKAVRSSMGSVLRLPVYEKLSLEDVRDIKERNHLVIVGTSLHNAMPYKESPAFADGIIAFGNEGNGMSEEMLSLCDFSLYIPIHNGVESLNVTAAAAIILFHTAE
ncbi:TrmH family RNA methyltransferase [Allisonella histaminiformans]|uniref:TrmH family RNA methyltransferase n=1 Tax=Allisonella histaminiformans TaxID=209880 RepID=UPI00388F488B